jgi:hypothetical protein
VTENGQDLRLEGKDALSLLRLLRGLECLVREERLDERHCAELMGLSKAPDQDWQERLHGEVTAACGLLEELLAGYPPQGMVGEGGRAGDMATEGLGSTRDTQPSLQLP